MINLNRINDFLSHNQKTSSILSNRLHIILNNVLYEEQRHNYLLQNNKLTTRQLISYLKYVSSNKKDNSLTKVLILYLMGED